jgi:hypothetical protein
LMIRPRRPWAYAATIVGCAAVLTYLLLIVRQSASDDLADLRLVALVAVVLVGLTGLTAVGALAPRLRVRRVSLGLAAFGWFALGYVALWSVGMLLLLAGSFAVVAMIRDQDSQL